MLRTRIAPTPSGYLHLGNLANFLLIEKLAGEQNATVSLRIDDCDGTRTRREFVDHIFGTLHWLGIRWSEGPKNTEDFYANHSQVARKAHYFERLKALAPYAYACNCSRKDIAGVYQGTCREKHLPFEPGKTAIRLHVNDARLAAEFGDVVLWRKDDGPAYQWVSVVDDLEMGINLIVRGEDLRESSALQAYIAELVQPGGFRGVQMIHHPLLLDETGKKLSKSLGATSVLAIREAGTTPEQLRARIAALTGGWA